MRGHWVRRKVSGIRMGGKVKQEGLQAWEAGSGGLVLALGPGLALLLGVKGFPWSLSKCDTRGWGRVLTYELGDDGDMESTSCLPCLGFVSLSLR